jgi:hypothetical protein
MNKMKVLTLAAALAVSSVAGAAMAQGVGRVPTMIIGFGPGGHAHANAAPRATPVLNHHGLPQLTGHGFSHGSGHDIGQSAGRKRHDHGDGV